MMVGLDGPDGLPCPQIKKQKSYHYRKTMCKEGIKTNTFKLHPHQKSNILVHTHRLFDKEEGTVSTKICPVKINNLYTKLKYLNICNFKKW